MPEKGNPMTSGNAVRGNPTPSPLSPPFEGEKRGGKNPPDCKMGSGEGVKRGDFWGDFLLPALARAISDLVNEERKEPEGVKRGDFWGLRGKK